MNDLELRFKILALLIIQAELPSSFQNKVDILADMIDEKSQYSLKAVKLVERQVLEFFEKVDEMANTCPN